MCVSLKGALGAAQGAQGGPFPISRGALGTPKSPDRSPKGVSEGPLGRLGMKNTEMETNSAISKTLKKRLFLYYIHLGVFVKSYEKT